MPFPYLLDSIPSNPSRTRTQVLPVPPLMTTAWFNSWARDRSEGSILSGCKRKCESLVKNKKKKRTGFHGFSLIIFIEISVNQCNPWRFYIYLVTLTSVCTPTQHGLRNSNKSSRRVEHAKSSGSEKVRGDSGQRISETLPKRSLF
jgi:hypothetical protein